MTSRRPLHSRGPSSRRAGQQPAQLVLGSAPSTGGGLRRLWSGVEASAVNPSLGEFGVGVRSLRDGELTRVETMGRGGSYPEPAQCRRLEKATPPGLKPRHDEPSSIGGQCRDRCLAHHAPGINRSVPGASSSSAWQAIPFRRPGWAGLSAPWTERVSCAGKPPVEPRCRAPFRARGRGEHIADDAPSDRRLRVRSKWRVTWSGA